MGRQGLLPSILAFAVLLAASACDRRVEPFVALEDEPPASERPVRIPGLEQAKPSAAVPPMVRRGNPPPGGETASVPGVEIRGTIELAPGAPAGGEGVLFVIARSGAGGPPLAVRRLPVGPFPLEFSLGPGDVMMQGRRFEGELTLTARVDRDGNPLTRGETDLSGSAPGPVTPGQTGISIRLSPGGG
ncbi:MAG: hypothetical protein JRG76_01485 [Deltaproteobacteria bacterium]|nr:hypothetical protein [Deltaproteobacteria bacterium]MBW2413156.1 hypothetical protein [Deltaproteobacteria bacterium]